MNNEKKTIIVDKEICSNLERLHYDVEARKAIITSCLQTEGMNFGNKFEEYQATYNKLFTEYNKAKQEMLKKYNVEGKSNWNLNFDTCELTF